MLTADEFASFQRNGFIHGFSLCSPDEMESIRREIEGILQDGGFSGVATAHRHLDSPLVHQLCAHPAIVERVASILGPELLLWHSRFFDKPPGSEPILWHQDAQFWPIEPKTCVSAWIAIDRADTTNGCLEVIPGSHRREFPHIPCEGTGRFGMKADPAFIDESKKVSVELEPGQFVIFDRWLLHGSPANTSAHRRLGLVARIIPADVRVDTERMSPRFPELGVQVIRGSANVTANRIVPPPIPAAALQPASATV